MLNGVDQITVLVNGTQHRKYLENPQPMCYGIKQQLLVVWIHLNPGTK